MRVDFSGVEPMKGGGLVPEGKYRIQVETAEEGVASTGTPRINMALNIVGGNHDGRTVWDDLYLTPEARGMTLWRLQCLGVQIPPGEWELTGSMLVGRQAIVTVYHDEYNGKTRAKVSAWEAIEGGAPAASAAAGRDTSIPF